MTAPRRRNLYRTAVALTVAGALLFTMVLASVLQQGIFARHARHARHAWRPVALAAAMLAGVVLAQMTGRLVNRQRRVRFHLAGHSGRCGGRGYPAGGADPGEQVAGVLSEAGAGRD